MGITWEKWVEKASDLVGRADELMDGLISLIADCEGCELSNRRYWQSKLDRVENSRDYLAEECRQLRRENYALRERNQDQWGTINALKKDLWAACDSKRLSPEQRKELAKLREVVPVLRRQLKNAKRREKRWRLKCEA